MSGKVLGPNGLPINALANDVRSRILDQPGDENLPNLARAGNAQVEIDARLDGSFRLSLVTGKERVDAVMGRDDFVQFIGMCCKVAGFK